MNTRPQQQPSITDVTGEPDVNEDYVRQFLSTEVATEMKTPYLKTYFSLGDGVLRIADQVLTAPKLTRLEFEHGFGQHMTAQTSALDFVVYGPVSVQLWDRSFVA